MNVSQMFFGVFLRLEYEVQVNNQMHLWIKHLNTKMAHMSQHFIPTLQKVYTSTMVLLNTSRNNGENFCRQYFATNHRTVINPSMTPFLIVIVFIISNLSWYVN